MTLLPVTKAHNLKAVATEQQWLIQGLWGKESVGIIGGEPKSCKSFLALSMAIAVTSGKPCLDHFNVNHKGRVLFFAAEDAAHIVRDRLDKLCTYFKINLTDLDLWIITAPSIHLNIETHRLNLIETVQKIKPTLLILDPFVRLHTGIDENLSAVVAPILDSLRRIQKRFHCAVSIVHHARKGAAHIRAGQALRGSSEFHAWGDSNLFLRRKSDHLHLDIEHRNQPGQTAVPIELKIQNQAIALVRISKPEQQFDKNNNSIQLNTNRILQALKSAKQPLRLREIRTHCQIRTATLSDLLKDLVNQKKIARTKHGWTMTNTKTVESQNTAKTEPKPVTSKSRPKSRPTKKNYPDQLHFLFPTT